MWLLRPSYVRLSEGGRTASDSKSLHEETKFKKDTVIEYKEMFLSLPFEIYPRF